VKRGGKRGTPAFWKNKEMARTPAGSKKKTEGGKQERQKKGAARREVWDKGKSKELPNDGGMGQKARD